MNTKYQNIRVLVARSIEAFDNGCDDCRECDTIAEAKKFARYSLSEAYQQSGEFSDNEWQRSTATSCMFGTGWRCFVVNEVDTCPADAQDLLLTFLDELPANSAFIATSNLEIANLTERFRTRLQRHEVAAPEPEEIARHLCEQFGAPALVAQQIAFLCGGNVRAAELDARAWQNEHAPAKVKAARVVSAAFNFSDGVTA